MRAITNETLDCPGRPHPYRGDRRAFLFRDG